MPTKVEITMAKFARSVSIKAPVEEVFNYWKDPSNWPTPGRAWSTVLSVSWRVRAYRLSDERLAEDRPEDLFHPHQPPVKGTNPP